MNNRILFYLSIILVIIWMGVIFFFSSASSDSSNNSSKLFIRKIIILICPEKNDKEVDLIVRKLNKPVRKVAHASVYFVLANFVNSIFCVFYKNRLKLCNLFSLVLCFLYACTDEFHQTFVNNRTGQFSDVIIDTFGAFVGCLIFNLVYNFIMRKRVIK